MRFFSRKAADNLRSAAGKAEWDNLWKSYFAYLAKIQSLLSHDWRDLAKADLHDEKIVSIDQPSKRTVVVHLTSHRIDFEGVGMFWLPPKVVGDRWLYHEIAINERDDVEFAALLAHDEIKVVAKHAMLQTK